MSNDKNRREEQENFIAFLIALPFLPFAIYYGAKLGVYFGKCLGWYQ